MIWFIGFVRYIKLVNERSTRTFKEVVCLRLPYYIVYSGSMVEGISPIDLLTVERIKLFYIKRGRSVIWSQVKMKMKGRLRRKTLKYWKLWLGAANDEAWTRSSSLMSRNWLVGAMVKWTIILHWSLLDTDTLGTICFA